MNWGRKYRPPTLRQFVGQAAAVMQINTWAVNNGFPQTIAIVGPYGVGKTTLARIIARYNAGGAVDVEEKNAANERGIEDIRKLIETLNYMPLTGKYRVKIIDEAHLLTGNAASALLKACEEPPKHVMFILCTSLPEKMPAALFSSGRCVVLNLQLLSQQDIIRLLLSIAQAENVWQPPDKYRALYEAIAGNSNGVPRVAIALLQSAVAALGDNAPMPENIRQVMILSHKAVPELSVNKAAVRLLHSIYVGDIKAIVGITQAFNGQTPDYLLQRLLVYNQKILIHNFGSGIDDRALQNMLANMRVSLAQVVFVQNGLLDLYREYKDYMIDSGLLLDARLARLAQGK